MSMYNIFEKNTDQKSELHQIIFRPWGSYTVLQEASDFKIKQIEVKPKASLSLQIHRHRSEHWIVVTGNATIVNGNIHSILHAGEYIYIPAGNRHRLSNAENTSLIVIEIQRGDYLGEDDIVRIEDIYGRV